MKKGIFLFLMIFASPLYSNGYQSVDDDLYLISEVLLWKFKESSADGWAQEITPTGIHQRVKLWTVPFKWKAGLRLGIGYNSCADDWNASFTSTWYQTKGVRQAAVSTGGLYSPFLGNFFVNNTDGANFGPNYRKAGIQWKVLFNMSDIEVGRTFYIDQFLKLCPFLGIKGGVINQNINSSWQHPTVTTTFTSATEKLKNNFWGVGPSLGVNTTWSIYQASKSSLNIIGNFSGAILWGHWRFRNLYQNNTPASVAVHLLPVNGASPMTRAMLGLEWVGCVSSGAKLAIRLGYEAQVWFNQVQYYALSAGRLNNQLSLQGGVLGFTFYF